MAGLLMGVLGLVVLVGVVGDEDEGEGEKKRPERTTVAPQGTLRFVRVVAVDTGACPADKGPEEFTGTDGRECLTVDSGADTAMEVERLESVAASYRAESAGWTVSMSFNSRDAERFRALSAKVSGSAPPNNRVATLLGDRLLSAPAVLSVISGGKVEISGGLTKEKAERLAYDLGARSGS
ncbi:hypothetical protein HUT18_23485 [Streptomyces sp. NA04227]|uniref:SecDF P1 head subdomain-containing protein n=1 Tax=Streptomyces sp. NA04227 TaxID=2742136 RepID=UPI00159099D0|nr:hypothetical protein [Streptomyces sp. NA04227]QKW08901.1 hypothetical protein HUT18_23485 [Streptomyces sp. NA04227]